MPGTMDPNLQQIVEFVGLHHSFAILSHTRADGDSLGSSVALGCALKQLGKHVDILQADPVPVAYSRLPGVDLVRVDSDLRGDYDSLIVLECNNLARTGLGNLRDKHVINIDHHSNTDPFGDLNWVDDSAAAVAELVYELILTLEAEITPSIASNLYAAILTDTGSFQFSNTTQKTFTITADLVSKGARPAEIAGAVYMSQPLSQLKLLVEVLSTLQVHPTKPIAWILLTRDMLHKTGATKDLTEGFVNYPLSLNRVHAVAFFREEGSHTTRVSLRSQGRLDVAEIARHWGGGGHRNAAGLTVSASLPEAVKQVVGELAARHDRISA